MVKINLDAKGQVSTVNPLLLFASILNGHDLSAVNIPKTEKFLDYETTRITLTISMNGNNKIQVLRHLVKPVPVDWHKLHHDVISTMETVEALNRAIIPLYDRMEKANVELEAIETDEQNLSDEDLEKILDFGEIVTKSESEINELEEKVEIARNLLLDLLKIHHHDIFENFYEVFLSNEGPVELSVSELIREKIQELPPEIENLFKNAIMGFKKGECFEDI